MTQKEKDTRPQFGEASRFVAVKRKSPDFHILNHKETREIVSFIGKKKNYIFGVNLLKL